MIILQMKKLRDVSGWDRMYKYKNLNIFVYVSFTKDNIDNNFILVDFSMSKYYRCNDMEEEFFRNRYIKK